MNRIDLGSLKNNRSTSEFDARIDEILDWCAEFIGPCKWNYHGIYRQDPCTLSFEHIEDLTAFKLKFAI